LYLGNSWISIAITSQAISWEDQIFTLVKSLPGKIVSEMTYNVSSEMLNPTELAFLLK